MRGKSPRCTRTFSTLCTTPRTCPGNSSGEGTDLSCCGGDRCCLAPGVPPIAALLAPLDRDAPAVPACGYGRSRFFTRSRGSSTQARGYEAARAVCSTSKVREHETCVVRRALSWPRVALMCARAHRTPQTVCRVSADSCPQRERLERPRTTARRAGRARSFLTHSPTT